LKRSEDATVAVYVEPWGSGYGSPYLVVEDGGSATAELVEDAVLLAHSSLKAVSGSRVAFVDGVRRADVSLYQLADDGAILRGVAGSHACGAVLCEPRVAARWSHERVQRLVIFGGGLKGRLPAVPGGWSWTARCVPDTDPMAPLAELQRLMRMRELELAETLAREGWQVVVDGPFHETHDTEALLVGYVKTHVRPILPVDQHRRVPSLKGGERSSLFRIGEHRYGCYLRLVDGGATAGPWSGIVRIDLPYSSGQAAATSVADQMTAFLPRFAGVPYRDPRAPQNLQTIGSLEVHLRHLLGTLGWRYALRARRQPARSMRRRTPHDRCAVQRSDSA
jgi:uncharacterized protein